MRTALTWRWLIILLLGIGAAGGCTTTPSPSQQGTEGQQADDDKDAEGEEPEFLDEDSEAVTYDHPRVATARETRHYVRGFLGKVDKDELRGCLKKAVDASIEPVSRPIFLKNLREVKDRIVEQPLLHHRCFYYGLMRLDAELAARRYGDDLEQVNLAFFARIRASALLATALGQHLDSPQYLDFLRSRYIELSHSYFGRRLVPDAEAPQQFPVSGEAGKRGKGKKPAGPWTPDD